MQRDLHESQKLLERIQRVMDGTGRVGIFPDLASQRTKSTEIMNQLVEHPTEASRARSAQSSTRA